MCRASSPSVCPPAISLILAADTSRSVEVGRGVTATADVAWSSEDLDTSVAGTSPPVQRRRCKDIWVQSVSLVVFLVLRALERGVHVGL